MPNITFPTLVATLWKLVGEFFLSDNSILLMFYHREVMRAAEILALVRTIVEWTWREPHFAPREATSSGLYELESIENLSILCDSTMYFHENVQL